MARKHRSDRTHTAPALATALPPRAHLNWMGGVSWDLSSPLLRLRVAASSCFFGEPMYYHPDTAGPAAPPKPARRAATLSDGQRAHLRETLHAIDPQAWRAMTPAQLMESSIDEALDHDPEATLALAVWLRNEAHMRTTPQVMLVRAAHHAKVRGTGLVRRYAKDIVRRADEPAVGLGYQRSAFGGAIPNALKRAWADALAGFSAYELAKHRMASRAVKTVDVMNLTHPRSAAVDALAKGALTTAGETWESIVSAGGSKAAVWREALPVMGHMALLRNLRNLHAHGLGADVWSAQLVEGARTGRQLPFRYYAAHRALREAGAATPKAAEAIERCLDVATENLPWFGGRVMSLCDNSGSARGATTSSMGTMAVATIANLTGLLAGRRADEGHVGVFGDRLEVHRVARRSPLMPQLDALERAGEGIGHGTENGVWLFWDRAIREKEHWDTVFVFSDMQAGHGGLYGTDARAYKPFTWASTNYIDVAALIAAYRAKVNPEVNVFLVQVAGYRDTLVPEFYERTYILGGWGEGLLRFAAEMAALANAPVTTAYPSLSRAD